MIIMNDDNDNDNAYRFFQVWSDMVPTVFQSFKSKFTHKGIECMKAYFHVVWERINGI